MLILGPSDVSQTIVASNLPANAAPRFTSEMMPALWDVAVRYAVYPPGIVAQAGKETNWGNYTGQVLPNFRNTCGLKIAPEQQAMFPSVTDDDKPLAHAMWRSWRVGATAHAQHLWAWCGQLEDSLPDLNIDPRWKAVQSVLPTKGPAETWHDLGGRWTTSPTYGDEIGVIIDRLRGA
jgi:hypothetical protein